MVGPRVAAAAAQAAVTAITEEEATPPVFPSSSHTTPVDTAPFHSTSSRFDGLQFEPFPASLFGSVIHFGPHEHLDMIRLST